MVDTRAFAEQRGAAEEAPAPDVSIVVTLYNETATVEELYRRTVAALQDWPRSYELLFVDDGSTDGTFAAVERLAENDPHIRAVRFKRNFGQHPAMHAGLSRARGEIVVTMDGDLQNAPEDIPRLVEAVDAGYDVASGRREARHDSWGRTLPSRLINGMLRRFTGVEISDFGCAFNAYRRTAVEPMLGSIGKQKFTKALVLSGGASVVEVDVAHAPRRGHSRYTPLRLAAADPVDRHRARGHLHAARARPRRLRDRVLGERVELPRTVVRGRRGAVRARHPGIHPRARRRVPGPDPAGRRGTTAVHDRPRAVAWQSACS
jgi:glycosyltransferase involved in cell wall biosynthesis